MMIHRESSPTHRPAPCSAFICCGFLRFRASLRLPSKKCADGSGWFRGKGLTGIMKESYPKWISYPAISLLFIANTINIGADLGAMAAVAQMVLGLPFIFWILFMTALTLILEIFMDYKNYSKFLMLLTLSLFAYFFTAFTVRQDWGACPSAYPYPNLLPFPGIYAKCGGFFRDDDFPLPVFLASGMKKWKKRLSSIK